MKVKEDEKNLLKTLICSKTIARGSLLHFSCSIWLVLYSYTKRYSTVQYTQTVNSSSPYATVLITDYYTDYYTMYYIDYYTIYYTDYYTLYYTDYYTFKLSLSPLYSRSLGANMLLKPG